MSKLATSQESIEAVSANKIQKAKTNIILNKPFFGGLIMKLKIGPDRNGHETLWTDARVLRYNEAFIAAMPYEEVVGVMAHEVGHCALRHPFRRNGREMKEWNWACDYVVNDLLIKDGFLLPKGALHDVRFDGMSAEMVYAILINERDAKQQQKQNQQQKKEQQQQKQQGPKGAGDGEGEGEGENEGDEEDESDAKGKEKPDAKQSKPKKPAPDADADGDDGDGDGDDADSKGDESAESQSPEERQAKENAERMQKAVDDAPETKQGDVLDAGTSGRDPEDGDADEGEASDADTDGLATGSASLSEAELAEMEKEWEAACASAAVQADVAGQLSADAQRLLSESLVAQTSYAHYMKMFIASTTQEDQSWSRPNRRGISQGIYLPAQRSDSSGVIYLAVDTSGSINERILGSFEGNMRNIHAELRPEKIVVLYVDSEICGEQEVGPYDEVKFDRNQLKGGGGTDFRPVFKEIEKRKSEGERVAGLIYLTDLDGSFPKGNEIPLDLPTLWVCSEPQRKAKVSFGETCWMY